MSARRWVCPSCGSGVLAPERPRKDDVRRYCLDCSKATGRLVERACPALDRRRAARRERSVAVRTSRAESDRRREAARRTVDGRDLGADLKRFLRLPSLQTSRHRQSGTPTVIWRKSTKEHSSGFYTRARHRITVTLGTDLASAQATLLHELVHAFRFPMSHGPEFWRAMQETAREAWPEARWTFHEAPPGEGSWRAQRRITNDVRRAMEETR